MRHVVFCNDQAAARFFVEAVNDSRAFFSADARKGRAMAEQRVNQSVLAMTSAGMNNEASRFIYDNKIVVFEKNVERNRLWLIIYLLQRRLGQFDFISGRAIVAAVDGESNCLALR